MTIIEPAETGLHISQARELFREYETWLGLDLCFQGFEDELRSLPGKYAPPEGRLFLAFSNGDPAGCIALRKIGEGICEMKRLYVRDRFRGQMIGLALIEKIIAEARAAGYSKMRLDTYPPKMANAVRLYESHGFYEIPPYYDTPFSETLFMEMML